MTYLDDNEFDKSIRRLAASRPISLPDSLEERILRCVGVPEKKEVHVMKRIYLKRFVLIAAALAVMAGCLTVGALAFSSETVIEKPVPVEQEKIVMEKMGITLILPDSWKGRYIVKSDDENCYVMCRSVAEYLRGEDCEDKMETGIESGFLFWVNKISDIPMTPDEFYGWIPWTAIYLFATEDGTYCINMASDVQYDPADEESARDYQEMYSQIGSIKVIPNDILKSAIINDP